MADGEKGYYFGQEQVPLTDEIREILEEYPDGQIFKEILQNADDAKATEVKFFIDERSHGQRNLLHPSLAKFQGPALLAYNDAVFTEEDWTNIQKLKRSDKRSDPFKVGKFGIGFNSVFHVTEFQLILFHDSLSGIHIIKLVTSNLCVGGVHTRIVILNVKD
ncbi:sacsin-like [Dysidea avara]|uniref:sacsin-like n=1 Tax=Dysidea avara TaxID=196820 RepID=UPI003323AD89